MKMSKEELVVANRERVARWREKNGWVGKQRAREASKRWYARKLAKEGRVVRGRAGRPRIGEPGNFSDIPKTEPKGLEFRHMGETHIEGFGPGIDQPYEERAYAGWEQVSERRVMGAVEEGSADAEEVERTRATLTRLEQLRARQARGGLNAGVEVELEC